MPNLPIEKDLVFSTRGTGGLNLRYLQVRAVSNQDTVSIPAANQGNPKRDVGFFAFGNRPTGSGVAIDAFYIGANVVRDFTLGNDIHVKNSAGQRVALVYLD